MSEFSASADSLAANADSSPVNGKVTVRFAPSPTGSLHLGNLRTAMVNAIAARKFGGTLQLRIEDTDRKRADDSRVAEIAADLEWMGIEWRGEKSGVPFRQSARSERHSAALAELQKRGRAYPCFCAPAELERARRMAVSAGRPPRYSGKCGKLSAGESAKRVAAGEAHAIRFRLPETGEISFADLARGTMRFAAEDLGDFVARRANGDFSFFFVNAVDDADLGVNVVLRGDDHLANTPRQLALLAALELPAPRYGHLSLMTDSDGGPLSKRRGATGAGELRAAGFLPSALWNYLARSAGVCRERGEFLGVDELAAGFEFSHLSRSPTRHDEGQFRHWQKAAVLRLSDAECGEWLGVAADLAGAVRENVVLPEDAAMWREILEGDAAGNFDAAAREAVREAGTEFFGLAAGLTEGDGEWKGFCARVSAATGRKGKGLYRPLRAGLTGRVDGPAMAGMFKVLGAQRAKTRLEKAGEV